MGIHSFDKIADLMADIFSEFNLICDQVISTITDNGSNFVKALSNNLTIVYYSIVIKIFKMC